MKKTKILFLCTGNSCRSQMAEGLTRKILGDRFTVFSAGIEAHGLNPHSVECMKEIGIDISSQHSKTIDAVPWQEMDIIITLCGHAAETCPNVPSRAEHMHWDLDDPAKTVGSEQEIMQKFRKVRDEIQEHIMQLKNRFPES